MYDGVSEALGAIMSSRVNHYLASSRSRRNKYAGCEHSKVRGITVRLLSPAEIDEFKARINGIINPTLRAMPKFRRSIV
jgi:hypothetical protein